MSAFLRELFSGHEIFCFFNTERLCDKRSMTKMWERTYPIQCATMLVLVLVLLIVLVVQVYKDILVELSLARQQRATKKKWKWIKTFRMRRYKKEINSKYAVIAIKNWRHKLKVILKKVSSVFEKGLQKWVLDNTIFIHRW